MQREIMRQRENAMEAKREASEAKQRIAIVELEASEAKQRMTIVEMEACEAKRKIAVVLQKMRSKGMTTADISEITGLGKEEVEAV